MIPAILIIDDEEGFSMFLCDVLENAGYAVNSAPDGESGLSLVKNKRFDLIVVDMGLPDVRGPELIERLRLLGCDTPVIAITGQPDGDAGLAVAEAYGAARVLFKPISPQAIVNGAREILGSWEKTRRDKCTTYDKEMVCHDNAD
jgi:DNA-binding response OmpR family regulator